jgi:hypothetical protein
MQIIILEILISSSNAKVIIPQPNTVNLDKVLSEVTKIIGR